ncbi:glycosyltransferase family 2 protein [Clostridium sp. 19966]|uniref:glycosyltransferase family 2 protein n=1 Tax=Clostridium sp. 19966 TaxID=2768166 RepID=UPI0028E03128|nr:glycosyltransferase [Clostridium sp. 19966]MDT8716130.1 glycosyltransferase family 2 protein [Clostridium sp. 19966]
MKFVFVILHYMTYTDTSEAIDSIFNSLEDDNYEIVVVDNNSLNDSFLLLKDKYSNNKKVYFIRNDQNLGFAKGNNRGYEYAKKQLKANFIILINNDIFLKQKDFLKVIEKTYNIEKPHIMGPDIVSAIDKGHQNPQRIKEASDQEIKKNILINRLLCILIETKTEKLLRGIYQKLKKALSVETQRHLQNSKKQWEEALLNVQLHGACLIFTPLYVKNYKGMYSGTFMYMEEDILHYIAVQENMKILYTPKIRIYHKEDASTNAVFNKENKKRLFYYKNVNKSSRILLRLKKNPQLYKDDIIENS